MNIRIDSVRLFDPGRGIDAPGRSVLIEGDRIRSLDAAGQKAERCIDGRGLWLVPGLVDLRAHLGEPGFTKSETIETAGQAAALGGFTTVVAMPTTEPTIDRVEVVELVASRARTSQAVRVLPAGALSVGREGKRLSEMSKLRSAGCVAFTEADRPVRDSQLLRYALETAGEIGVPIISHADDETLSLGGVMHEGLVSTRLALAGIPSAAEAVGVARDLALAELTGARLHFARLSSALSVDLVRQARRREVRVTAEVSPLHLLLNDTALLGYDTRAKLHPPLRAESDRQALLAGLRDGTIDAVVSDHLARSTLEKNTELDRAAAGSIGLETTLSVVLGLVWGGELTLERAISVLTRGPADVLGMDELGRLVEGGVADMTLIDPELPLSVNPAELRSKSQNTPLLGRAFRGRSVLTIAAGRTTYRHESLA